MSLLGRVLPLFPDNVPLEDFFTESVAYLLENRPKLCLEWLEHLGVLAEGHIRSEGTPVIRVFTQWRLGALEGHATESRPDLAIEVHEHPNGFAEETESEGGYAPTLVLIESKVGSKEGNEQLRRYAEHLSRMEGFRTKVLMYITREYDPKRPEEFLTGLDDPVHFEQLRWQDFYRFLCKASEDTLVGEILAFMEEQHMARSYNFTTMDLIALSGMPGVFDLLGETLDEEVREALTDFTGNKLWRISAEDALRNRRYIIRAPLHEGKSLYCAVGYRMPTPESFPITRVALVVPPNDVCQGASVAAIGEIAQREGWEAHNLDNPSSLFASVVCERSIAAFFDEEDHVAALKRFFIAGIEELGEALGSFKDRNPGLLWDGRRRNKVKQLGSIVDTRQRQNTRQFYWRDPNQPVDVLVHDIKLADDLPVAVGARLSDQGWEIKIFVRDGGDMEKLRALLQSIGLPFEEGMKLNYPVRFSYDDPVEEIQPHLQEIVDKIAEATAPAEPRRAEPG